jgi:hypothetical protein
MVETSGSGAISGSVTYTEIGIGNRRTPEPDARFRQNVVSGALLLDGHLHDACLLRER